MTDQLVVIGGGGFGREVVELVSAINAVDLSWQLVGVLDDDPRPSDLAHLRSRGVPHVGPVGMLTEMPAQIHAVIAIGSAAVRQTIHRANPLRDWATLIHPDASVGSDVRLGSGSVVAAGARLSTNITIGQHGQIDQNVTVGHDVIAADYVRLNPQACISGAVIIGEGVVIGANASVLQCLSVGARSVVGAGAVVVRDIAARATVKGVPAR